MKKFFTPIQLCYDIVCAKELVPWISDFDELNDKAISAVLIRQCGEFQPGMYLRRHGYWLLALNYEDFCSLNTEGVTFKVIVDSVSSQTFTGAPKLFSNGYPVPGSSTDSNTYKIWTVAFTSDTASGGGSGPTSTVTVTDMFGSQIGNFYVA